jgi:hypothetical protein
MLQLTAPQKYMKEREETRALPFKCLYHAQSCQKMQTVARLRLSTLHGGLLKIKRLMAEQVEG